MGKVTEHLLNLISKQVETKGVVVWYDPDKVYASIADCLSIPGATVLRFEDSYFLLRQQIEPFLEYIDSSGKLKYECCTPPKLIIYIPKNRRDTNYALVEAEAAGVVLEPGATAWQLNTRLRVIAEQVFKKIAPDSVDGIARQVEEGLLTLVELDRLSLEVEGITTGAIKLIFGTASPVDVALDFAASVTHDEAIRAKNVLPELKGLLRAELGIDISSEPDLESARRVLRRTL